MCVQTCNCHSFTGSSHALLCTDVCLHTCADMCIDMHIDVPAVSAHALVEFGGKMLEPMGGFAEGMDSLVAQEGLAVG